MERMQNWDFNPASYFIVTIRAAKAAVCKKVNSLQNQFAFIFVFTLIQF
jgi:hypothetical protein